MTSDEDDTIIRFDPLYIHKFYNNAYIGNLNVHLTAL